MKVFEALLAAAPVTLAAIVRRQARQGAQASLAMPFNVVLHLDKTSSEASVTVQNADRSEVLGYSCGTSLGSGAFQEFSIAFDVQENGAGNLSIGSDTYLIHEDPDISGGITCGRLHSNTETLVTCSVALPESLHLEPLDQTRLEPCFSASTSGLTRILAALESGASGQFAQIHTTTDEPLSEEHSEGLDKRQGPCAIWTAGTELAGDGNPHQNPFNIQLSSNMQCDSQRSCSIPHTESNSYTVSYRASAPLSAWTSGGFAVVQSVETGNNYECAGNPGDFFCLWKKVGQTGYEVENVLENACTGNTPDGGKFMLYSPNANDVGSFFYCVYGKQYCRNPGDGWLETDGPAGSP